MSKRNPISLIFALCLLVNPLFSQVKIIFDTDFGGDADDLGALAMLHNFVDKGECDLLAIMCWSTEQYAVPALDAVNRFYQHPNIPIGVRKGDTHFQDWSYSKPIVDHFPYELKYEDAPEATSLYREILAKSEDQSIVVVTVGPLMNIQNLLNSKADSHSSLNGKELIEKKVKEFVIMGGQFPQGEKEWNFDGNMPGVTRYVLENITVPIVFSGFELGVAIKSGAVFNDIYKGSPLYVGFRYFSEHAPWMKANFKGRILDNSTFDQTAVLYAVKNGVGTYWDKIEGGYCKADDTGGNIWVEGKLSNHSYLKLKVDPEEMATRIESLMLDFPATGNAQTSYDDYINFFKDYDFDQRVVPKIPPKEKKLNVIIDADAKNEIDDQWALALAFLSPERFNILGLVGATFAWGGPQSIDMSCKELDTLLEVSDLAGKIPIYPGAHPMRYRYEPSSSAGVDFIIEKAMEASKEDPLWVIGLGAATDIASAFLKEPHIAERIVVFWHLRTQWPDKCLNFNVFGDPHAARLLFDAPIPFVLFDTGTYLTCPMSESEKQVKPYGALGEYLHDIRYGGEWYQSDTKGFFDLGDIAAILDPDVAYLEEVSCPEVDHDLNYKFKDTKGKILRVFHVDRDKTFQLLYDKLQKEYPEKR